MKASFHQRATHGQMDDMNKPIRALMLFYKGIYDNAYCAFQNSLNFLSKYYFAFLFAAPFYKIKSTTIPLNFVLDALTVEVPADVYAILP